MSLLFYKRPPKIPVPEGHLQECKLDSNGKRDCSSSTIPPELSFEQVVCNKCQAPCTLQDFLDYLTYVTHDAENLQFYLWMIDYFQRFRNAPAHERGLSPRWTGQAPPMKESQGMRWIGKKSVNLYDDGSKRANVGSAHSNHPAADFASKSRNDVRSQKASPNPQHPAPPSNYPSAHPSPGNDPNQWLWYTADDQPFRAEVDRIAAHYIAQGSPRQLNLSAADREKVMQALQFTTHPSALRPVKLMLDSTLRAQSHPNFVRWSICNNNRHWTWGLRIFAVTSILIGFTIAILLTLSGANRYWRIFPAILWWFGLTQIIAASQGLCVLLHRMHTRQYHAWESKDPASDGDNVSIQARSTADSEEFYNVSYDNTRAQWPTKMEVFGPTNDYSQEGWIASHARKSFFKKLFEKRVKVQQNGLNTIQDRMVRQAEAWAFIITVPLTVGFCAIPPGHLF